MKKKSGIHWQRPLIVTAALILLVAAASFLITGSINQMEEERSFERLYEETTALVQDIETHMKNDREQLELIAALVEEYEDPSDPELWEILDRYTTVGMMSRLEMLLPDNTVLLSGQERIDASGLLSFEEAAAQGAHVTGKEADISSRDTEILRHYVPVLRDGRTIAMLYGVIELGSLPDEAVTRPYGGQAAIYLIDGSTGDFFVDTWHSGELGNIWDLGERPMAEGYNHEQLKQGLIDGDTGYVVFVSRTIGRYLYFYYEPVQINEWRLALSVPEDVVFANANLIRRILNAFLGFEAVCFLAYFFWMFLYVRQETSRKQRQLDTINYVYDIENLLFNAHEKQENIVAALEKIANITSAEKAGFWLPDIQGGLCFVWEPGAASGMLPIHGAHLENAQWVTSYFRKGNIQLEAGDPEAVRNLLPAPDPTLKNLIAVPVRDVDSSICGVLSVFNLRDKQVDPTLLKSVSFSFSMFFHNMRTYNAIKTLGERDLLTGLYNRNRYERDLPDYQNVFQKSLACIYMDANGLHELNNSQGHEAGDRMLQAVARQIRNTFGTQHSYRIGGDEFLVFAVDLDRETVYRLGQEAEEALSRKGIHVSIGIRWATEVHSVNDLIKEAEEAMYAAKRAYYEKTENDRRIRL